MKEIKYRYRNWELCDSKCADWYKDWIEVHNMHKNSKSSYWMELYELASQKSAHDFIFMNFAKGTTECLNANIAVNEAFLEKYNSKQHKKMTETELEKRKLVAKASIEYSKWLLGENNAKEFEKEQIKLHRYRLEITTKKAVAKKERSKLIRIYIKFGYFEEARELNKIQYTSKVIRKLKTEDIYNRDKFFYYLTEYLIDSVGNKENEQAIKDCFLYFFDELLKGNESLFAYDDAGRNLFMEDMAYIWYKYFSDIPFEQIKPTDIVKSSIIGIHCDKTE